MKKHYPLLFLALLLPTIFSAFSLEMFFTSRYDTDRCFSGCFDEYDAFYCRQGSTRWCCKSSINTNLYDYCRDEGNLNYTCSYAYEVEEFKYMLCLRDDTNCGSESLEPDEEYLTVYKEALSYENDTTCYYEIQTDYTKAALFGLIEIAVDYYFACEMFIVNGDSVYNATNLTIPEKQRSYIFPALGSNNQLATIWVIFKPDSQTEVTPVFQFKYKMVIDGVENYYDSNGTVSDQEDDTTYIRISIVKLVFSFIGAFFGVILLGMLGSFLMTKIGEWRERSKYQGRDNKVRDFYNDEPTTKKHYKSTARPDDYDTNRAMKETNQGSSHGKSSKSGKTSGKGTSKKDGYI